jgi:hypothetical protein
VVKGAACIRLLAREHLAHVQQGYKCLGEEKGMLDGSAAAAK